MDQQLNRLKETKEKLGEVIEPAKFIE